MSSYKFSFFLFIFAVSGCASTHKVIYNPEFKQHKKAETFNNIYKSVWSKTKYDEVNYLKKNEIEKKEYSWGHGASSPGAYGLSMTKGYDPSKAVVPLNWKLIKNKEKQIKVTWLSHATFLITMGDIHLVTDPVLYDLPFAWLFDRLKRATPPLVTPQQLNFADGIVISHNHYDHLDWETLNEFDPNKTTFMVPLRTEQDFPNSYPKVVGMDWYTNHKIKDVTVHFVPVQHWTKRSPWDRNKQLWGGWIIEYQGKKVFFAGDTGYSQIFKDIKKRYGAIDVCLIPIVAYRPYRYRRSHLSPEMALDAGNDLACKQFIPWGHGTFTLGYEHVNENVRRLKHAAKDKKPSYPIHVLKMGETFITK